MSVLHGLGFPHGKLICSWATQEKVGKFPREKKSSCNSSRGNSYGMPVETTISSWKKPHEDLVEVLIIFWHFLFIVTHTHSQPSPSVRDRLSPCFPLRHSPLWKPLCKVSRHRSWHHVHIRLDPRKLAFSMNNRPGRIWSRYGGEAGQSVWWEKKKARAASCWDLSRSNANWGKVCQSLASASYRGQTLQVYATAKAIFCTSPSFSKENLCAAAKPCTKIFFSTHPITLSLLTFDALFLYTFSHLTLQELFATLDYKTQYKRQNFWVLTYPYCLFPRTVFGTKNINEKSLDWCKPSLLVAKRYLHIRHVFLPHMRTFFLENNTRKLPPDFHCRDLLQDNFQNQNFIK